MENKEVKNEAAESKPAEQKKSLRQELTEDIILVIVMLTSVFILSNFILINAEIPSGSMEKTIMTGDRIFGNRLAYKFHEPERGDIVIFKFPDNEKKVYIKRLIGLPGDEITVRNGRVYLNGAAEPLEEPYLPETPNDDADGTFVVPENSYFMLGDNRNHSNDSREWENTFVTRDQILAKAALRYYPLDKIGILK